MAESGSQDDDGPLPSLRSFAWGAVVTGGKWAYEILNLWGAFVVAAALAGIGVSVSLAVLPAWIAVLIIAFVVVGVIVKGAHVTTLRFIANSEHEAQVKVLDVTAGSAAKDRELARLRGELDGERDWRELPKFNHPKAPRLDRARATRTELASSDIHNRTVFLADIPLEGERVRNKTFSDCDVLGPAIVALRNSSMEVCSIGAMPGDPESVIWQIPEGRYYSIGALVVENCRFVRCATLGIGFAGKAAAMDQLRGMAAGGEG